MLRRIELEPGQELTEELLDRKGGISAEIACGAADIVDDVRARGDVALGEYTSQFDGATLEDTRVSADEIANAYEQVDDSVIEALRYAAKRIEAFHSHKVPESWTVVDDDEVELGQKITPIDRVGVYVPGGTAPYPSSVLMNVMPAKVAGVDSIAMATPPTSDGTITPAILVAADIAGVDEIYKMGGAHAIGALAYGTETIAAVDKIVGPGNAYVAAAKKHVDGDVGIDMIAGPSEVLIIADESADPRLIAIDLMAQAEHDMRAATYLVTTDPTILEKVEENLKDHLKRTSRADITQASLRDNSVCVVCDSIADAIVVADRIAPEHLEVMTRDADAVAEAISNAGAIFVGAWTPESAGDYVAGPNHVLPTQGTARFSSALSTDDFLKKTSILRYTRKGLERDRDAIKNLAGTEGLWAHREAVTMRFDS
ncbi:MAG: histidinol dehydrogenase [Actinomycetia bacterium]|nr:histidinol dehydrogenase [Actinomycetes bacterium]